MAKWNVLVSSFGYSFSRSFLRGIRREFFECLTLFTCKKVAVNLANRIKKLCYASTKSQISSAIAEIMQHKSGTDGSQKMSVQSDEVPGV